jgi:hypothetical protein
MNTPSGFVRRRRGTAARRQLDAAGDDACGQREQAPVQLAQLVAEERVDGETARAGERHAEASEPEHQRVGRSLRTASGQCSPRMTLSLVLHESGSEGT